MMDAFLLQQLLDRLYDKHLSISTNKNDTETKTSSSSNSEPVQSFDSPNYERQTMMNASNRGSLIRTEVTK